MVLITYYACAVVPTATVVTIVIAHVTLVHCFFSFLISLSLCPSFFPSLFSLSLSTSPALCYSCIHSLALTHTHTHTHTHTRTRTQRERERERERESTFQM